MHSIGARLLRPALASLSCCSVGACKHPEPGSPPSPAPVTQPPTPKMRVLVTGFHDWEDLGVPPALWRCRDNPSCRILIATGAELEPPVQTASTPPTRFDGPLPAALRATCAQVQWNFATLPVVWGAADDLPRLDYDVVIHLGLGVYDRLDRLLVEHGAWPERAGVDAAGNRPRPSPQGATPPREGIHADPATGVSKVIEEVEGLRIGDYQVAVANARPSNRYLCNETHWSALRDLNASVQDGGRLHRVFFVHLPRARTEDGRLLGEAVGKLAGVLVGCNRQLKPHATKAAS